MKKISFVLVCAFAVMLLAGCTTVVPGGIGSGEMGGKVGEATSSVFLGLIPMGDSGIMTAAAAGGISKVSAFDVKVFTFLGLYTTRTTIVTGN